MDKKFYNLYEAAEVLGVGYSTLRRYIKEARMPFVLIGKRKFITAITIREFEQSASAR